MAEESGFNVKVNFNYFIEAIVLFMSRIIIMKLNTFQKVLFRNLKEI